MKIKLSILFIALMLISSCSHKENATEIIGVQSEPVQEPKKLVQEQYKELNKKEDTTYVKEIEFTSEKPVEKKEIAVKSKAPDLSEFRKDEAPISKAKEVKKQPIKKAQPKVVKRAPVRAPIIEFEETTHNFGEIVEGDKIYHKFMFKNVGKAPLSVRKATATCGCTQPSFPFIDILPGEEGYIGVNYYSVGKEGEQTPEITVYSNSAKNSIQILKLEGFVKPKEVVDTLKVAEKDSIKTEEKD